MQPTLYKKTNWEIFRIGGAVFLNPDEKKLIVCINQ